MADVLPEIELALSLGAPRDAVVKALNDDGIPMTMTTFAANLYRLRKAPRPGSDLTRTPASTPSTVAPRSVETPHRYGQHDPRRLDDVMRSTPDMKALAKLASKGHP